MATADNRAYLALCFWHFAQNPLLGTSDTLRALYEIKDSQRFAYQRTSFIRVRYTQS